MKSSRGQIKISPAEILKPSVENFDLSYRFSADLREVPKNPNHVFAYCKQGIEWITQEMQKPEEQWDIENLVKMMGKLAAFLKMIRELESASELIETALALIEQYELGLTDFVVQSLRWADILRYREDYTRAEQIFAEVLELCEEEPSVAAYKDFALQHLGKLYFDLEQYDLALGFFRKALEIRHQKKDASLLESTELAIATTQVKLDRPFKQ